MQLTVIQNAYAVGTAEPDLISDLIQIKYGEKR